MAAKKKKAYERIEKSLEGEDVSEIRGECQAQCDEALIKIYRKIVDDLDRKEELEKELTKLTDKISKLGEREETVAEDYLGKWSQLKATTLSSRYKDALKKVAQRQNKESGGAPESKRTTWTEDKVLTAIRGTEAEADSKGFVEGKTVLGVLNAPSIDVLSQRLACRTGDILAIIAGKGTEPVINEEHKVPKPKGTRAKYKVNVKKIIERLNG